MWWYPVERSQRRRQFENGVVDDLAGVIDQGSPAGCRALPTTGIDGMLTGMRTRRPEMWWGPALEAPDPAALARFYHQLLEWPIIHEEAGTTVMGAPGGAFLVFHQADGYEPPVWPPVPGEQRPMMHLDFQVGDLEDATAEAIGLGARLADHQPQDNVRVMFDPAGHPFCLCRDDG